MSSEATELFEKKKKTKNIITYAVVFLIFIVALWLSTKSEGPSKFPKVAMHLSSSFRVSSRLAFITRLKT